MSFRLSNMSAYVAKFDKLRTWLRQKNYRTRQARFIVWSTITVKLSRTAAGS